MWNETLPDQPQQDSLYQVLGVSILVSFLRYRGGGFGANPRVAFQGLLYILAQSRCDTDSPLIAGFC